MIRPPIAVLALLALPLAACQHVTQTNGDETLSATALFTNINVASDCLQQDGDGNIISQTHHTLTTNGDAATLHEAGGILASALAFAGKFVSPVPGMGAREGAVPSPQGSPAATGCSGERTTSTPGNPPLPPVPAPPPSADETPQLLLPPPRRPAALFAPGPHRGGDGRVRVLQARYGEEVWYTLGGKPKILDAAAWLALVGGGR